MGARDLLDSTAALAQARTVIGVAMSYAWPSERIGVAQWSERSIILSAKDSAEPGPYRVDRTPYARDPMDALSQHSPVEEVVLMLSLIHI